MFNTVITDTTLTIVTSDGVPHTTDRSNTNWDRIKEALKDPSTTEDTIVNLMSPAASISAASVDFGEIVVDNGILYFNGVEVHSALANRIVDIYNEGLPLDPWVAFAKNVFANPDVRARDELYLWLEKSNLPITEDGHFLAYKKVKSNFKDIYTGKMDNSPGTIVSMPREQVDPNRNRTCSQGLHFCSKDYLPHFGTANSSTVVVVKVNPADVVSIPSDYDNSKGRTWRYEVLYEVNFAPSDKSWNTVVNTTGTKAVAPKPQPKPAVNHKPIGSRVVVKKAPLSGLVGKKGTITSFNPATRLYQVRLDGKVLTNGFFGSELDLITDKKTKKNKKKDKKMAVNTKSKKAVTINTLELGVVSRKQYKEAIRTHGSAAAWARTLGLPAGTVRKWKARLWPKTEG